MRPIYWLTGQPGAGKTTIARQLMKHLAKSTVHIDGDDLRRIFNNTNYSTQGREQNIIKAQNIAKFLSAVNKAVVVSMVSPYRKLREDFKKECPAVIEIYVHTSAIRGREHLHVPEYEPPLNNYIDIDTTDLTIEKAVEIILFQKKP